MTNVIIAHFIDFIVLYRSKHKSPRHLSWQFNQHANIIKLFYLGVRQRYIFISYNGITFAIRYDNTLYPGSINQNTPQPALYLDYTQK